MKRLLGTVLTALLVLTPGAALAQEGGTFDFTNTVTVSAGGKVDMEADLARIHFGVRALNQDAAEATREVAAKTEAVIAGLKNAGVRQSELTVGGVRVERRTRRRQFLGYIASVSIKVETDQLDLVGEFIDAAVVAGATSVRGLEYDVKDRSAAVDQALREAMAFARAKATALAESAGRGVGPAIVISEYDSRPPRAVSFNTGGGGGTAGGAATADAFGATIPVEPPTLSATARITVTFELT